MPTPSEQKALAFLAFVILLGGAVRVVRAGSVPMPTVEEQGALARQAAAAESAGQGTARKKPHNGRKVSARRRHAGVDTVAGVADVPFQDVRPDRPGGGATPYTGRDGWVNGFPPPLPRIDVDNRHAATQPGTRSSRTASAPAQQVDLDVATVSEIQALPRIGPALAARIVADREALGPFGSLDALGRVKGMGPGTRRALSAYVTFSRHPASTGTRRRDH